MPSSDKMLQLLDLFTPDRPLWQAEEMQAHLGASRSTLYRYLKCLSDAGLIAHMPRRGYSLGPRIIEMDRQIATSDPLIQAARPVMRELAARQPGVVLLCRRYEMKVLCVHQERAGGDHVTTYERGKAQSLLQGAASLVVLAHLSPYQINRLHADHAAEIASVGLAEDLPTLREALRRIRHKGWWMTEGEVTEGVTGIAAPVFDAEGEVLGSLSVTIPEQKLSQDHIAEIANRLTFAAGIVTRALG